MTKRKIGMPLYQYPIRDFTQKKLIQLKYVHNHILLLKYFFITINNIKVNSKLNRS